MNKRIPKIGDIWKSKISDTHLNIRNVTEALCCVIVNDKVRLMTIREVTSGFNFVMGIAPPVQEAVRAL